MLHVGCFDNENEALFYVDWLTCLYLGMYSERLPTRVIPGFNELHGIRQLNIHQSLIFL